MKKIWDIIILIAVFIGFLIVTVSPIFLAIFFNCGWFLLLYFIFGIGFLWFMEKFVNDLGSLFDNTYE
jgi:energy-coupling factor transporter transmembrane protein EcfT